MRWVRVLLLVLVAGLAAADAAAAAPFLPPRGHLFAGLTGGTSLGPYERMVGKHPSVFEVYMTWNTPTRWLAAPDPGFRSRLALHLSTTAGYGGRGVISPAGIAAGRSDPFLLGLGRDLAHSGRVVYLRIMGEMDAYWNPYAAFAASGASRGAANSPRAFVAAWRRTVLILRGGPVGRVNAALRRLGLPELRTRLRRLARPKLAILWVPQDAGSPETAFNTPGRFWPGAAYVDWVGTDFYGSYPNFGLLSAFYRAFPGKPFVFSEWALLGFDDPSFVHRLFGWVRAHPRVRMLNYYQGFSPSGPPSLRRYPAGRAALRAELRSHVFLAYAPEYAHPPRRHHRRPPPERPPLPPVPGVAPAPPAPAPGICLTALAVCVG